MNIKLVPVMLLILTAFFIQCSNSDSGSDGPDPAEELYGKTWQSNCTTQGVDPGKSQRIDMTFSSGGGFTRVEEISSDDACSALESTTNIDKSFTWVEKTADPEIKKLTYTDESDSTVYALYKIEGSTLKFAESDSAYPADLTTAIDFN